MSDQSVTSTPIDPANPPADPRLVQGIQYGFKQQETEYEQIRAIMALREDELTEHASAGTEPPPFLMDGEPVEYIEPSFLEETQQHVRVHQQVVMERLETAKTSNEQLDILLDGTRTAFYGHVLTGYPWLTSSFVQGAYDYGLNAYRLATGPMTEEEARLEQEGQLTRVNHVAKQFWRDHAPDLSAWLEITDKATDSLCELASAYSEQHEITETNGDTPGALAALRYGRIVGVDGTQPAFEVEHREKFKEVMTKLIRDDLFGPYQDGLFGGGSIPELAWFIGRALDVIEQQDNAAKHERTPIFTVHDKATPNGRLPKLYEKIDVKGPPVTFENRLVMLQDETIQQRIIDIAKPVLERHSDIGVSLRSFIAAAADFEKTHKLETSTDLPPH